MLFMPALCALVFYRKAAHAFEGSCRPSLDGVGALRVTIINLLTTPADLDELLDAIRRSAGPLIGTML